MKKSTSIKCCGVGVCLFWLDPHLVTSHPVELVDFSTCRDLSTHVSFFLVHLDRLPGILANCQADNASCGTTTDDPSNSPPNITIPESAYTIPKNTPFELVGTTTDPNGDLLPTSGINAQIGSTGTALGSVPSPNGLFSNRSLRSLLDRELCLR